MLPYLKPALATVQLVLGLAAVLLTAAAVSYLLTQGDSEDAAGPFIGTIFVLGVGLLLLWGYGRNRRRALVALAVTTGALTVAMLLAGVIAVRPVRYDLHQGLWLPVWTAAGAFLLWAMITAAAVAELRVTVPADASRRRLLTTAAIAVPLVLISALSVTVALLAPHWMVRANSRSTDPTPAAPAQPSALTGELRWNTELEADEMSVPTGSGLAVALPSDRDSNAGVGMLDPADGSLRWHHQLKGVDQAPELQRTDGGRAVVVSFDEVPDPVSAPTYTLAAETGRVAAFWPSGELKGTDPPVQFDHVARGTNAVIGLAPSGRKLWTYRPERCADPRDVTSTPSVTLVYARTCDDGQELLGMDAQTGEQLWRQPVADESAPSVSLARQEFQLEVDHDNLQKRRLDTGAISWTAEAPCADDPLLVAAAGTGFLSCDSSEDDGSILAHDLDSGDRLWRQQLRRSVESMVAVDDRRVLALTGSDRTCRLDLVGPAGAKTLLELPTDQRSDRRSEPRPDSIRCGGSHVFRLGETYVVQLSLPVDRSAGLNESTRYRFVGLA